MTLSHEDFMNEALRLAEISAGLGEVPVGAVIVFDGRIVGRGYNRRELSLSVLEHAELNALRDASNYLGRWRLVDATVYSTLEPCIMCAGALVHARITALYYGAADPKFGGIESLYHMAGDARLNHQFEAHGGLKTAESAQMLKEFFQNLRSARTATGAP